MTTHGLLLVVAAVVTSTAAIVLGRRGGARGLGTALVGTIELVGAAAVFFAANVVIGMVIIVGLRRLTAIDLSPWEMADSFLIAISWLQALVFETWRRGGR